MKWSEDAKEAVCQLLAASLQLISEEIRKAKRCKKYHIILARYAKLLEEMEI